MPRPKRLDLIIFDLDGTLIDSREDLVSSVNAMLASLARPLLPAPVEASYVGEGAAVLVQRALQLPSNLSTDDEEKLLKIGLELFLSYYRQHKLDHTRLYPGVAEAVKELSVDFALAILTNKPVRPSREIVCALGLDVYFAAVYGGDSFERKKPDPMGVHTLLRLHDVGATNAVIVGDSSVDVLAGRNAGIWTCGVTYGFAPESLKTEIPDWTVDSFPALACQLQECAAAPLLSVEEKPIWRSSPDS